MPIQKSLLITNPFWQTELERLSNPAAIRMSEALDPSGPLGIGSGDDPFWKGFKHTNGKKDSNIDFLLRVKKDHPDKIVIVQVGEFYETWALDSVFLVEYCGLNRMGRGGPRAGTPLANIQGVLERLTEAGFSVVICEQAEDTNPNKRKTRFVAEIVTPSSPIYTYGLAMDRRRADTTFPDCPPEFGVVCDKRGVTIVEVNPDLQTVLVLEALTPEAARMRLMRYGGRLSRVFCHENVPKDFLEACHFQHEHIVRVPGYLPREFPRRVEELLKIDLSLPVETKFTYMQPGKAKKELRPRPLYLGTAQQIGLLPAPGIPSLIEELLPPGSPLTCQHLLRTLLLNPPTPTVAADIRKTLQTILSENITFPDFAVANPARYVKTLHKGEASPEILRDLCQIAQSYLACKASEFQKTLSAALSVVEHLTNLPISEQVLQKKSTLICDLLTPIIPNGEDRFHEPQNELISKHLFVFIEDEFRGRVAATATPEIRKHYTRVEKTAQAYERALTQDLLPLIPATGKTPALSFDIHNRAIWLRGAVNTEEQKKHQLVHPQDRYGKPVRDRWTTEKVETALEKYKAAVEDARLAVAALLRELSKKLAAHSLPIVQLTTFSNLLRTLILHAREGQTKQWGLSVETNKNKDFRLALRNFFPYWMLPDTAVRNSVELMDMALLTGHNMAGKSTLLRSAAVVSLLASTGLLFPAEEVALPEAIDGWFVRTGTHDDPASGLSAFAVEVKDLKTALRDASKHSLLFIDELGKGTESHAGHAIAGSVLEHLQQRNIRGIFATHWHELFVNPTVKLDGIQQLRMAVCGGKATYEVEQGACLTSWAFETAGELGLDKDLIKRAHAIADGYPTQTDKQYPLLGKQKAGKLAESKTSYGDSALSVVRNILSEITCVPLLDIRSLSSRSKPFVKDGNQTVLYVLQNPAGFFYVGETDDIHTRLAKHYQDAGKRGSQVLYALIPQGKSVARKLETKLIKQLQAAGLPLLSGWDGLRRR